MKMAKWLLIQEEQLLAIYRSRKKEFEMRHNIIRLQKLWHGI
jgi:hypothetical protein